MEDDGIKILKILEKGEKAEMEELFERIERNEARLIKKWKGEGILENMLNIIKNMLQQNVDEEKIMKYTNAKKEDIEMAKKELGI